MPKIDVANIPERTASNYPAEFQAIAKGRSRKRLGDAGGLTDFGVNLLRLEPGAGSSHRHWHSGEDEFVYVISGEVALVSDSGSEILRAGECAAFPKGAANGHHIVNKSSAIALCLEIGSRTREDIVMFSDIDLMVDKRIGGYRHKDGTPYPKD